MKTPLEREVSSVKPAVTRNPGGLLLFRPSVTYSHQLALMILPDPEIRLSIEGLPR